LANAGRDFQVLCLGAHCDDIEIGCGGTLIELARTHPSMRFKWIVLSSDARRGNETRDAARRIGKGHVDVELLQYRNGYFPGVWTEIKDYFETLKLSLTPDLIFTHSLGDRHQDHRVVAELTWNTFRNHLILEYEIPKYEGELGQPNVFVPIPIETVATKVSILMDSFTSQRDKKWFTNETFQGLMRLRGIECNSESGHAEGFHSRKLLLDLG